MSAGDSPRLGFSRTSRLRQGRDFLRLKKQGQRMAWGCLLANWLRLPPGSKPRLGVVTSGKLGDAVQRNRARRLLRESFRLHQRELAPVDLVLVARASILGKRFSDVEKDFLTTVRKAGLLNERVK